MLPLSLENLTCICSLSVELEMSINSNKWTLNFSSFKFVKSTALTLATVCSSISSKLPPNLPCFSKSATSDIENTPLLDTVWFGKFCPK